jgi:hypothetical protein
MPNVGLLSSTRRGQTFLSQPLGTYFWGMPQTPPSASPIIWCKCDLELEAEIAFCFLLFTQHGLDQRSVVRCPLRSRETPFAKNIIQQKKLQLVFWGQPQTPWFRFAEGLGAHSFLRSRTTLFASFSGKRRISFSKEKKLLDRLVFWGQPQTPWFRFAEGLGAHSFLRSRTTLFASFSGKRRISFSKEKKLLDRLVFWGQPQTPWLRFAEICEQSG